MPPEDLSRLKIEKGPRVSRPSTRKRIILWGVAVLLLAAAVVLYLTGVFMPAVQVEVGSISQIYPSQTFTLLNASGYVVAQRRAAVSSKITSRIISLAVEEGSRVKEGQVIAQLESDDALAERKQAEANLTVSRHNLDQARAELHDAALAFERNKELLPMEFVTKAEYDASEARHKRAQASVAATEAAIKANAAALEAANVAVEYALIRAPFDAVVLTKNADVGDIITPLGAAANARASVVTIADMNSLQVEVDVSESNVEQVKAGQPCEIQLDALPDKRFRGVVHMVVPTADRTKATVMVKIRFLDKDSRILPEMSAKVSFLLREVRPEEQKPRTAINPAAVVTRNGKKLVFLVKENRVVETAVTLGEPIGDMIELLEGAKAGDKVVIKPPDKLRTAMKIKAAEK